MVRWRIGPRKRVEADGHRQSYSGIETGEKGVAADSVPEKQGYVTRKLKRCIPAESFVHIGIIQNDAGEHHVGNENIAAIHPSLAKRFRTR